MLLWSSGNHVISVVLWQLMEHKSAGLTSAYAIMQLVVISFVVLITQRIAAKETMAV